MNGLDPQDLVRVTRYLQTLKRALGPLAQSDRTEIVAEIESHITERLSGTGASVTDILAGLGEPDTLARAYLDSRDLSGALSRSAPGPLLAAILARATRSGRRLCGRAGGRNPLCVRVEFRTHRRLEAGNAPQRGLMGRIGRCPVWLSFLAASCFRITGFLDCAAGAHRRPALLPRRQ